MKTINISVTGGKKEENTVSGKLGTVTLLFR